MKKTLIILFVLGSFMGYSQLIQTIAGTGVSGSSSASGVPANINIDHPWDLATDSNGNVYFSEQNNSVVRRIDAVSGEISTILGTYSFGLGPSGNSSINYSISAPTGICIDQNDQLYVADFYNNKIFKINLADSSVTVVCGTGSPGYVADGSPATSCNISKPQGLAIGTDGLLYYVEGGNNIVRRIQTDGTLFTVAGIAGTSGSTNGPVTSSTFLDPFDLAIDSQNSLYVSQPLNGLIRKIDQTTNTVSTYAGTGINGFNGDSIVANGAQLNQPYGLSINAANELFVAENGNHIIRKITPGNMLIQTVVGTGTAGYSGDGGLALEAELNEPTGVHVDANGIIYLTQIVQDAVRSVRDCEQAVLSNVASISGAITIDCNETISLSVAGDLNDQTDWYWYTGGCGDVAVNNGGIISKTLTETTTFYVQAEGVCLPPSSCGEITINVNSCDSDSLNPNIEVTTAFSPNNDQINDFLFIDYAEYYPNNTVIIYNRWGDELDSFTNYDNEEKIWDGTDKFGVSVESGTYFYIFESDSAQFTTWVNVIK